MLPSSRLQSPVQMRLYPCNRDKFHIARMCDRGKNSVILKSNPIHWGSKCTFPTFANIAAPTFLKCPKILLRSSRPAIGICRQLKFSLSKDWLPTEVELPLVLIKNPTAIFVAEFRAPPICYSHARTQRFAKLRLPLCRCNGEARPLAYSSEAVGRRTR